MKKILFALLIAALATPLMADDAKVLPQGVFRLYTAPVFSFSDGEFEDEFRFFDTSSTDSVRTFALGLALEYGVNDWITAAVQWTPGVVLWSDIDADTDGEVTINPWLDVFTGAKFQVIGPEAPVQREDMRFAAAAGVTIPLPGADWEKEADNSTDGKDFVASNADTNLLGAGFRLYYDYIFTPNFFLNLFSEFIAYPIAGDAPDIATYGAVATNNGIQENVAGGVLDAGYDKLDTDKFGYGYDLTLEIEPQYEQAIAPGVLLAAGFPITYTFSPELTLDGEPLSEIEGYTGFTGTATEEGKLFPDAGPSHLVTVQPNVEVFFTTAPVPTALQIGYRHAVAGQNSNATNAVILVMKNYLAF